MTDSVARDAADPRPAAGRMAGTGWKRWAPRGGTTAERRKNRPQHCDCARRQV